MRQATIEKNQQEDFFDHAGIRMLNSTIQKEVLKALRCRSYTYQRANSSF